MEPVKKILIRLKGSIEKEEATRLCTQLLALINKEDNLLKETVSWLVSSDGGSEAFHQICRQAVESDALQLIARTLSSLAVTESCSTQETYLKLILSSRIMERLVLFLDTFPQNTPNLCSLSDSLTHAVTPFELAQAGTRGIQRVASDSKSDPCNVIRNAITYFILLQNDVGPSTLPKKDRIVLLHLMEAFLKSDMLFRRVGDGPFYAEFCLTAFELVIEEDSKSDELKDLFSSPENRLVSNLISFGHKYPFSFYLVSRVIARILDDFENTSQLLEQANFFSAKCINRLAFANHVDECGRRGLSCADMEGRNLVLMMNIKILRDTIRADRLGQLEAMEKEYNIIPSFAHVLKQTGDHLLASTIVTTGLQAMIKQHELNFLTQEKLEEIMPIVWKKMKLSKHMEKVSLEFTYSVMLLLLKSCCSLDLSVLECVLVNEVIEPAFRLNPVDTTLLKLLWMIAKFPNCKRVFKKLCQLSCDKSVEYTAPGKTELAKIFKFISDIITKSLEREPPHKLDYLQNVTKCMVEIARSSSLDEEMYVLEDMVSPAMWLLKKQSNEKIVANVKEFISILH
ncbi:uncharacterized protein LOC134819270 [Bolinopsis microptera]|uniref:uncharacterized protein LOC134819270 n=1 Tax=Bolinopsis microptera TaxID=2820187 RepID=UPI00307A1080